MQSETSLTDKTMDLQVEKADRASGYLDGGKHGDIVEGRSCGISTSGRMTETFTLHGRD
jgi:hypothetical protein